MRPLRSLDIDVAVRALTVHTTAATLHLISLHRYAITIDGEGVVTERVLGDHVAGIVLNTSVTVVSNTVSNGLRTVSKCQLAPPRVALLPLSDRVRLSRRIANLKSSLPPFSSLVHWFRW